MSLFKKNRGTEMSYNKNRTTYFKRHFIFEIGKNEKSSFKTMIFYEIIFI